MMQQPPQIAAFPAEFPDEALARLIELIGEGSRDVLGISQLVAWSVGCLASLMPRHHSQVFGCRNVTPAERSLRELVDDIRAAQRLSSLNRESQAPFPAEQMAWLISVLLEIGIRKTLGASG